MTGSEIYLILTTIFSGFAAIIAMVTVAICRIRYQRELESVLHDIEILERKIRVLELLYKAQTKKGEK